MNILKTSHDELSKVALYRMTKSPAVCRMSDVDEKEEITVSGWCVYEEPDNKEPDTINRILSIMDENTGFCYATNSATFQKSFAEITDIFGNTGFTITVMHGTSKNGRDFITAVFGREV